MKILLLALVGLLLIGCGSWINVHAPISGALLDASEAGETLLRDARTEAMHDAGAAVQTAGGDDTAVIAAVDAAAEPFECPIAAYNLFAAKIHRYAREVLSALSEGREPDMARVALDLEAGLGAYATAQACTDLDLPALPVLPGGWL